MVGLGTIFPPDAISYQTTSEPVGAVAVAVKGKDTDPIQADIGDVAVGAAGATQFVIVTVNNLVPVINELLVLVANGKEVVAPQVPFIAPANPKYKFVVEELLTFPKLTLHPVVLIVTVVAVIALVKVFVPPVPVKVNLFTVEGKPVPVA